MNNIITVGEISNRLAAQTEDVVRFLLPNAKRVNGHATCGDIQGNPGDSLKIDVQGQSAGRWRDWADDTHHGDLIDLWQHVRGTTAHEAIKQAKEFLGIRDSVVQRAVKVYKRPLARSTSEPNPQGRAWGYLTAKRGLEANTLKEFKVETDPASKALVFPCYSPSGELINRSYRTVPTNPSEKKKVWQDAECAPSLFGWQALPAKAYKDRRVLLAEGQIDAMTWHQWGIPALSVPNGSGLAWVEYEWENLEVFDEILIAFDMDGPGREIAKKTIARLGIHRCLIVEFSGGKDPNEAMLNGATAETAQAWVDAAKPPSFSGLVRASDIQRRIEALCQTTEEAWSLPFFRKEWPDVGLYFRPGEVTLWTGVSSHGKSTFLGFLVLSAVAHGMKAFIASMEVKAEKTIYKMIKAFSHSSQPTSEEVGGFLEEFGPDLILADRIGYVEEKDLFDMMRFAFQRYGCSHFMIDSLMRISGLSEEYTKQAEFMNKLQEFAKETDSHIHLVAHPRKLGTDGKPALMDIKGSSDIPNNADNVIAVCRNMDKMNLLRDPATKKETLAAMWDTEIRVEKQRESGWAGAFQLRFDIRTGVFSLMSDPVTVRQSAAPDCPF